MKYREGEKRDERNRDRYKKPQRLLSREKKSWGDIAKKK